MLFGRNLAEYLIVIPAVLIAIMVHEVAHGAMAYALGDNTAKERGRLNFNPVNHIDPMGFLCMILVGFGWAKPVPVNMANIKNKKVGMPLVALAGPMANFLLAFAAIVIALLGYKFGFLASNTVYASFTEFMLVLANLSIGLGVFNLIPVPPLDGSNIIFPFLPNSAKKFVFEYGSYIRLALVLLLVFNVLDGVLITARSYVLDWIFTMASLVVGAF